MVKAYEQFQLVKVLFGESCKSYSINSDQQRLKICNERANLVPYFVHFPASVQSSNYIRDHLTVILQMNLFAELWEQKQLLQNTVNPNVIESVRRCIEHSGYTPMRPPLSSATMAVASNTRRASSQQSSNSIVPQVNIVTPERKGTQTLPLSDINITTTSIRHFAALYQRSHQ